MSRGGPAVVGSKIARAGAWRGSWSRSAALTPAAVAVTAWPAGMPALRVRRTAGGPVERERAAGAGGSRGTRPRRAGPAGMPALWGWAGGRPRTGRRGLSVLASVRPGGIFVMRTSCSGHASTI